MARSPWADRDKDNTVPEVDRDRNRDPRMDRRGVMDRNQDSRGNTDQAPRSDRNPGAMHLTASMVLSPVNMVRSRAELVHSTDLNGTTMTIKECLPEEVAVWKIHAACRSHVANHVANQVATAKTITSTTIALAGHPTKIRMNAKVKEVKEKVSEDHLTQTKASAET